MHKSIRQYFSWSCNSVTIFAALQRYTSLQVIFKIFVQICYVVICKEIFEFLPSSASKKIFFVAAANRFKVFKTFISLKVTVYIQYRRLRSKKALEGEGFEWKSNCTKMAKYTCDYKHKIYCNIYIYIAKPGQAVYFTFSSGIFRTLSNV